MRHLLSTVAIFGLLFPIPSSGFSSSSKLSINNSNIASRTAQHQQHDVPSPLLFPINRASSSSSSSYPNKYSSIIVATQMSKDDTEEEKTLKEDEAAATGEAAVNELDVTTVNGDAMALNGDAAAVVSSSSDASSKSTTSSKGKGFSLLLLPTLLFKFTIVLIVKFVTDICVYPLLWSYRIMRVGKRKLVGKVRNLFGRKTKESKGDHDGSLAGEGVVVNGDLAPPS